MDGESAHYADPFCGTARCATKKKVQCSVAEHSIRSYALKQAAVDPTVALQRAHSVDLRQTKQELWKDSKREE